MRNTIFKIMPLYSIQAESVGGPPARARQAHGGSSNQRVKQESAVAKHFSFIAKRDKFLEVHMILKPGLTYDVIEQAVLDLVQRTTKVSTPMLSDNFNLGASPVPNHGWVPSSGISILAPVFDEPIDVQGKQSITMPGKGKGKVGKDRASQEPSRKRRGRATSVGESVIL